MRDNPTHHTLAQCNPLPVVNESLTITFEGPADFQASSLAEGWCKQRGISVGIAQRGAPRGLLVGDYLIAKWRNLGPRERAHLHGTMRGDMRHGPVTITIKGEFVGLWCDDLKGMYGDAINVVRATGRVSICTVQRHLQIGYNRAAGFIEQMERDGIVTAPQLNGQRELIRKGASA